MNITKLVLSLLLIYALLISVSTDSYAATERDVELSAVQLVREVSSANNYKLITVDELKKAMEEKQDFILIDNMPYNGSYRHNHIPGALNITMPGNEMPIWDSEMTEGKSINDFLKLLGDNKNKKIIFYCGFVMCKRSHVATKWAKKLGFTNVYRLPGGINAWRDSGYLLEKVE